MQTIANETPVEFQVNESFNANSLFIISAAGGAYRLTYEGN
ncbi:hypothetical protein [uncultured Winogradskyella sp.]|nr:hypothetical protein [uncultured Winogradskyella sp.]